MVVRQREPDLVDLRMRLEDPSAHLEHGLLQRQRVGFGEPGEQQGPHRGVQGVEVQVGAVVPPAGGDVGGQDPVGGLGQGGVPVPREAVELGSGGLQHGQPLQPGHQAPFPALREQHRGADLGLVLRERMVVVVNPVPGVLLGGPASAGDPVEAAGEVVRQAQQELLRRADAVAGEGVDGVLLRVGGHHMGVVALGVRGGEVAVQLGGHAEVLDGVPGRVPGDLDQPDLGLAVLVGAEHDARGGRLFCCGHGVSFLGRWSRQKGSAAAERGSAARGRPGRR